MRRPLIAGNWKMYKTVPQAVALVEAILSGLDTQNEVVVAPPFTALHAVAPLLRGRPLALPKLADKRYEALLEWEARLGGA